MRILLALLIALPLAAQQQAPKPEEQPAAPAAPAEAQTAKPEAAAEAAAPAPTPAGEPAVTGTLDFGYRWRSDIGGSIDTYRSVVDLGSGPKLFGADFTVQDPKKRLFDRLDVRAYNWGDDPYQTLHVGARKLGVYDFTFDYRNMAYFDYLPSFADPLLPTSGVMLNERSFDLRRKLFDAELDFRPGKRIIPYLAFSRDGNSGHGVTTFVSDSNEFPVPDLTRDSQNNYRGGLRLEFNRFHATLEQGGTTYKDDFQTYWNDGVNNGNRLTPLLGRQLTLNNLLQAYGVRGDSIYTRVMVTANPVRWADLFGQFLFSQPKNDVNYFQSNQGNFVLLNQLLFYNGQQDVLSAQAEMPHTSGNVGVEVRPFKRLRILQSWMTDRLHTSSLGLLSEQFLVSGATRAAQNAPLADRLVMNYSQEEVNALFDILPRLTVRGGYRRVWGDAEVRAPQLLASFGFLESGKLDRNVGLAGVSFRPSQKLSANFDFEGASSDHDYFRTSLHDYQRMRARARYQLLGSLSLGANFSYLNNDNPSAGVNYSFLARQNSLSAVWTPAGGKLFTIMADYTRSTVDSSINYLEPNLLSPVHYVYRDNAHIGSALADINLPGYAGMKPKLSLGGSFFVSSGSRPTSYYQPLLKALIPLQKHVYWTAEWRWYGFGETFYQYEGFRAHMFMTGLRLAR